MSSRARVVTPRCLLDSNKYHGYYKNRIECETSCILGNAPNVIFARDANHHFRRNNNMNHVWLFQHPTIPTILAL